MEQEPELWALRKRIVKDRLYYDQGRLYRALRSIDNGSTVPIKKAPAGFYEDIGPWPTAPVGIAPAPVVTAPVVAPPVAPTAPKFDDHTAELEAKIANLQQQAAKDWELIASLTEQNLSLQRSLEKARPAPIVTVPGKGPITFTPSEAPVAALEAQPI